MGQSASLFGLLLQKPGMIQYVFDVVVEFNRAKVRLQRPEVGGIILF